MRVEACRQGKQMHGFENTGLENPRRAPRRIAKRLLVFKVLLAFKVRVYGLAFILV
jgi:hypothetical protein